jgi:hypothetical protein
LFALLLPAAAAVVVVDQQVLPAITELPVVREELQLNFSAQQALLRSLPLLALLALERRVVMIVALLVAIVALGQTALAMADRREQVLVVESLPPAMVELPQAVTLMFREVKVSQQQAQALVIQIKCRAAFRIGVAHLEVMRHLAPEEQEVRQTVLVLQVAVGLLW